MDELHVEVLVIGWGKGGKTLAASLGRAGTSVAVVERSSDRYGGGCINVACVPTKDLIHSAAQRRADDDPQAWFSRAVGERDTLTAQLRARNHAMLAGVEAVTLIDGEARFVGPREVEVTAGADRLSVHADRIVINTGTVPFWPDYATASESRRIFDSEGIQHVDPLPRRLVVVGGGYVGIEFAGMFAGFGSHVTLVDRNAEWMREEDRDVAEAVAGVLRDAGVEFALGAEVDAVEDVDGGVHVRLREGERVRRLEADAVLVATKEVNAIAAMPRPKIVGETRGLIKVIVDAENERVLGATVFSVDAQELINLLALAIREGVSASALRDGIWTHPRRRRPSTRCWRSCARLRLRRRARRGR